MNPSGVDTRRSVAPSQVGTDLTDIGAPRQFTIRELGGCMAPIWPSYFGDCRALLVGPGPWRSLGLGDWVVGGGGTLCLEGALPQSIG